MQSNPKRITRTMVKRELVKQRLIHCAICPIHRGENSTGFNRHRNDRYKNHRRS